MKIGLFGGSFNPVHYGHLEISKKALKYVDEVWIMPCCNHPFRKNNISFHHRYKMIEIALKELGNEKIKVSDFEYKKNKKSETINTLKKLANEYPDYDFIWILGSDVLSEIKKWKNYDELMRKAVFLIVERPGFDMKNIPSNLKYIGNMNIKTAISSTKIREKIKNSENVNNLLPNGVINYIKKNELYKNSKK